PRDASKLANQKYKELGFTHGGPRSRFGKAHEEATTSDDHEAASDYHQAAAEFHESKARIAPATPKSKDQEEAARAHLNASEKHDEASILKSEHEAKRREAGRAGKRTNNPLVINPPVWAEDADVWARAETAADKGDYDKESGQYYQVVTKIYKNMGGAVSTRNANNCDKPMR